MARRQRLAVMRATKADLTVVAGELGLDDDPSENRWLLLSRILRRSAELWAFARSAEESDPDRKEWPWTESTVIEIAQRWQLVNGQRRS